MDQDKTGGSAFPNFEYNGLTPGIRHKGMTLLDWFAGQALMGMLASPNFKPKDAGSTFKMAFNYADCMIAEKHRREKEMEE